MDYNYMTWFCYIIYINVNDTGETGYYVVMLSLYSYNLIAIESMSTNAMLL